MLVHRVTEELLEVLDAVIDARVPVLGGLAALGTLVVRALERLQLPRVLVGRVPDVLVQVADALGQRGMMQARRLHGVIGRLGRSLGLGLGLRLWGGLIVRRIIVVIGRLGRSLGLGLGLAFGAGSSSGEPSSAKYTRALDGPREVTCGAPWGTCRCPSAGS